MQSICETWIASVLVRAKPVFSISFWHPCNQMRGLIIKFLILVTFCPETPVWPLRHLKVTGVTRVLRAETENTEPNRLQLAMECSPPCTWPALASVKHCEVLVFGCYILGLRSPQDLDNLTLAVLAVGFRNSLEQNLQRSHNKYEGEFNEHTGSPCPPWCNRTFQASLASVFHN